MLAACRRAVPTASPRAPRRRAARIRIAGMLKRTSLVVGVRAAGFALVLAASAPALAQAGAPAATMLPGLSALPRAPADTRLPGIDPRECGTSKHAALCAMGRWAQFAKMDVTLKAGAFTGAYTMEKPDNGEVLTTYAERMPGGRRGGEVLLVSDDSFAYRTRETLPSDVDMLDYMLGAPNMMTQLVAVLLDQGVLEGPSDVTQARTLAAGSTTAFLRTETPNTAALYGPPWRVTGTVRPSGDGRLAYSLRLTFRPVDARGKVDTKRTETIDLAGNVSYGARRAAMPDTFDLVGWKLVRQGNDLPAVATLQEARRSVGR